MEINDFIECMGVLLYGKGRFFRQESGVWYDRACCDYVTVDKVLERIYEQCSKEIEY